VSKSNYSVGANITTGLDGSNIGTLAFLFGTRRAALYGNYRNVTITNRGTGDVELWLSDPERTSADGDQITLAVGESINVEFVDTRYFEILGAASGNRVEFFGVPVA
jgi:hypothetical protein